MSAVASDTNSMVDEDETPIEASDVLSEKHTSRRSDDDLSEVDVDDVPPVSIIPSDLFAVENQNTSQLNPYQQQFVMIDSTIVQSSNSNKSSIEITNGMSLTADLYKTSVELKIPQ